MCTDMPAHESGGSFTRNHEPPEPAGHASDNVKVPKFMRGDSGDD